MTKTIADLLYRTPYFVMPRLALEAMPEDWQAHFVTLMEVMERSGLKTPEYLVFRDLTYGNPENIRGVKQVNRDRFDQPPFYRMTGGYCDDPWANYRHGNIEKLCPSFSRQEGGEA